MYLQIKKAEFVKNKRGKNDIKISMIWLYEDNWKYIRFVKLQSDELLEYLKNWKIQLSKEWLF